MCNPPFHASLSDAQVGSQRKWRGLGKNVDKSRADKSAVLNFGGQSNELYCEGGEEAFVTNMINESTLFATQCLWFTTLISKATTLPSVYRALKQVNALEVKTIEMKQGQKQSRVLAWRFINTRQ
jgi:23S rRNA (adenine1618-N6)-methyltransferase